MPLIIVILLLSIAKYFEVALVADLSWWWIAGLICIAFLWFEFGERMLGLDKRRAHEEAEKLRRARVKKSFQTDRHKR